MIARLWFHVVATALLLFAAIVFAAGVARADSAAWVDADDNMLIMQEFVNTVQYVEDKYGTGPINVFTVPLAPNVFALAGGNRIEFNELWSTGDYAALNDAIQADVDAGFHNGGCNPIQTIALHEAAHIIDQNRGGTARLVLDYAAAGRDLRPYLAGYSFDVYGSLDPGEALAEAFQAVECGSADEVELVLYRFLVGS